MLNVIILIRDVSLIIYQFFAVSFSYFSLQKSGSSLSSWAKICLALPIFSWSIEWGVQRVVHYSSLCDQLYYERHLFSKFAQENCKNRNTGIKFEKLKASKSASKASKSQLISFFFLHSPTLTPR